MSSISSDDEGSLQGSAFAKLFLALHRQEWSGDLILGTRDFESTIRFQSGHPLFAESTDPEVQLLSLLMDQELMSDEQLIRVQKLMADKGCTEEQALLALRILEPKELLSAVREQTHRRIINCFRPQTERYRLEEGEIATGTALRSDPLALLLEGLVTHSTVERLMEELGPELDRYPCRKLDLTALCARLEGPSTGPEILAFDGKRQLRSLQGEEPTLAPLATTWILHQLDAIAFLEEPAVISQLSDFTESEIEIVVAEGSATSAQGGPRRRSATQSNAAKATPTSDPAMLQEINERYAQLRGATYYQLLGIPSDANAATIKRSYFALAKRYHPDALRRSGLDQVRDKAKEIFAEVAKAYDILSDPKRRREYDDTCKGGLTEDETHRVMEAEAMFRKAEILLRMRKYDGALKLLQAAVRLWPDEAAYQAALGWAHFKSHPSNPQAARKHLEIAINLNPQYSQGLTYLSQLLRQEGETERADQLATRAKQLAAD